MKKQIFQFLLFSIPFIGISQLYTPGSGVTDIDGNTYQTIVINGQEWMAENLRTSRYANGDSIPNISNANEWNEDLTTGAWAHYNNDSQFENPYGKHYNWFAAADPRNACPVGWHMPTYQEWAFLLLTLGGDGSGGKLKSIGTIEAGTGLWYQPNLGADNSSGFNALPAGFIGGGSELMGSWALFWTSSIEVVGHLSSEMYYVSVNKFNSNVELDLENGYRCYSIRCLKNLTSDIEEIKIKPKTLIRIFDIMGVETIEKSNEVLFYQYSDGSVEKKLIIE
jgi:uncharacterized protein (TIGR02145 family)